MLLRINIISKKKEEENSVVANKKIRSPARAESERCFCLEPPGSPQTEATGFPGIPGRKPLRLCIMYTGGTSLFYFTTSTFTKQ